MKKEIVVTKTDKPLCAAQFDLVDKASYTFTDCWGNDTPDKTKLKITFDDSNLYFIFRSEITEPLPEKYKKKCGKVYRADCTELFICFDGNMDKYYEFDISPFNKAYIADTYNFNDEGITTLPIDKSIITTATQIHDTYYDTLYILPFKKFISGTVSIYDCDIRFNAFRVKVENGKRVSRVLNNTNAVSHHIKSSFIKLVLER